MTSERSVTWVMIWAVIRIVSHLEESGIPQEAYMAGEAVIGEKTLRTAQKVGPGWQPSTMVWVMKIL